MWGINPHIYLFKVMCLLNIWRFDKTFMTNLSIILEYVLVTYSRLYFVRARIYFLSFLSFNFMFLGHYCIFKSKFTLLEQYYQ